jgi:antitoxin MazE
MRAVVKKWGNSASVRIPKNILRAVQMEIDDVVELREDSGRIVIWPAQRTELELAELLKGITRQNLHQELDFGGPLGKQAFLRESTRGSGPQLPPGSRRRCVDQFQLTSRKRAGRVLSRGGAQSSSL